MRHTSLTGLSRIIYELQDERKASKLLIRRRVSFVIGTKNEGNEVSVFGFVEKNAVDRGPKAVRHGGHD